MIHIEMNTTRLKLTVTGHAQPMEGEQYREACSAVGALAQSLMYTVGLYNGGEGIAKSITYKNQPGDLLIKIFPEPWAELELKHRFRIYGDGMQLMAESHPEFVEMIRDGERILPPKEEKSHE